MTELETIYEDDIVYNEIIYNNNIRSRFMFRLLCCVLIFIIIFIGFIIFALIYK
jgi:hypothetical protein